MATISDARAIFGLQATGTHANSNVTGLVQIGPPQTQLRLVNATKIISFDAVIAGAASDLIIDISDLDNTGSTAWTAGVAQVETATAAGTITLAGNASVTVTAAGMTGSPKTISVAVANTDTAATWAGKVRTALAADTAVAALFTVSGTTTAIVLTRKPSITYTVNGASVPLYVANDATLNIALDNGTCTGITTAATSANSASGVLTVGTYAPDLDGNDFEGETTGGLSSAYGVHYSVSADSNNLVTITSGTEIVGLEIPAGGQFLMASVNGLVFADDVTIETTGSSLVTVTIAGV